MPCSANMDPKYAGPYLVVQQNWGATYILHDATGKILPSHALAHHLQLVSLQGNLVPKSFVVKLILDHCELPDGSFEYQVKWANFLIKSATWEPESNFDTVKVITKYWHDLEKMCSQAATSPAAGSSAKRLQAVDESIAKPPKKHPCTGKGNHHQQPWKPTQMSCCC